jgi:hypothetical protein
MADTEDNLIADKCRLLYAGIIDRAIADLSFKSHDRRRTYAGRLKTSIRDDAQHYLGSDLYYVHCAAAGINGDKILRALKSKKEECQTVFPANHRITWDGSKHLEDITPDTVYKMRWSNRPDEENNQCGYTDIPDTEIIDPEQNGES